jgi:hypothetical protein
MSAEVFSPLWGDRGPQETNSAFLAFTGLVGAKSPARQAGPILGSALVAFPSKVSTSTGSKDFN